METMRLRAIQQPSHVEALLESLATGQGLVPADAYPIGGLTRLPPELRILVHRMQGEEIAWRAWTDDRHVWLLSGELSLPLSRERRCPVLQIRCYDEDARLLESAVWLQARGTTWERCGA